MKMKRDTKLVMNDSIKNVRIVFDNPTHLGMMGIRESLENLDRVSIINSENEHSIVLEYDIHHAEFWEICEAIRETGLDVAKSVTQFNLKNFHCVSCKTHLESALLEIPGIISVKTNLKDSTAEVEYVTGSISENVIKKQINDLGYF
jgi:copper chaperone CopZ